jgi:6-phosphogluconate dehydrogenase
VFPVVKRGSERSFYHAWGQKEAYELVAPILKQIAAVAEDGEPCVTYIGADGAGHYVKMVHNGIEYGDMQLIAEAYALLKGGLALSNEELAQTFTEWNEGELSSYLIDITKDIFTKKMKRVNTSSMSFLMKLQTKVPVNGPARALLISANRCP